MQDFLPVTKKEMKQRGWEQVDFAYITGDAYVDHPSFGTAIISRLLESRGYKVGIIPQPDWKKKESIQVFGEPRLGFLVSAGNMDSMVNHYTVSKKHRQKDSYSPGGQMGLRPDRAVIVYSNLIRQTYKKTPIILGGIEASLRRLAHYDYWENKVKHSVLIDSGADMISYGMGEHSIIEIADALASGLPVEELTYIAGTVFKCKDLSRVYEPIILPSYEEVREDKKTYADSFAVQYQNTDPFSARPMAESYGTKGYIVQNPPAFPLTQEEMDDVYAMPYTEKVHPMYEKQGGIPALEEIKFSLTSNRGCFGGCNFCALAFHQGRMMTCRSHESVIREVTALTHHPGFKGYIHDVGGPTANLRHPSCKKQLKEGVCAKRVCLAPKPCPNLDADESDYVALLRKLRKIPGIKKIFIRSGIRYDYMLCDKRDTFFRELVQYHVSGQLKVAPEHCINSVLDYMGKPHIEVYERFQQKYNALNKNAGKKQFLVPYLMSSHPGSTLQDAVALAEYLNASHRLPEQVQDFYPVPGCLSTCMYHTGIDPRTMKPVYVATDPHEKALQRALLQWKVPENWKLVREALQKAGREDLIGFDARCLIRPYPPRAKKVGEKGGEKRPKGKPEVGKGKKSTGRVEKKAGGKKRKG